jgi:dienelactone hydrolase
MQRAVTIWSEGSRLAADIFTPDVLRGDRQCPAILLCHGWGGLKSGLTRQALRFVEHGFAALVFDYRGWGESDGRIISSADGPMLTQAGPQTLEVRVVREIVDPVDQLLDVRNAFSFLLGEDCIDTTRVGIWGTSYGGGHAVSFASREERVRAVVAQIGGYDHPQSSEFRELARSRLRDRARGAIDPPVPQAIDVAPGLKGTPDVANMLGHRAVDLAEQVRVPTLILDAEFEELVDRKQHGLKVFERISRNAPSKYLTYPCKHYDVYSTYLEQACSAAVNFFKTHLAGPTA